MQQKRYTKEFKDSTIQLVLNGDKSATEVANNLGIQVKTLYYWIRKHKEVNNIHNINTTKINKNITKETLQEETRRLRAENKRLRMERDILKKATAYFAKETL